jgi:DNA modification methylase
VGRESGVLVVTLPEPFYADSATTLHQGDSLEIMPLLPRPRFDLVVTDPPYMIGAVSTGSEASKSGTWHDMMNSAHWFAAWYRTVREQILAPDGAMWTFLNWRTLPVIMRAAGDAGFKIDSLLVWDKEWIGPGGSVGLRPSYEMVALMSMPDFAVPDRGIPDIRRAKWAGHKPTGHPAEKPVALLRWLIEISGKQGGSVLDPFMGSGSTMVAAREAGCPRSVGIEQHGPWLEVAVKRLAQENLFAEGAA